jgi:hypothetical protein
MGFSARSENELESFGGWETNGRNPAKASKPYPHFALCVISISTTIGRFGDPSDPLERQHMIGEKPGSRACRSRMLRWP